MYKTEFEHENNTNYMILISDNIMDENYQIKMLRKNTLKWLLPISVRCINNTQCYYYNITSRQQVSKLFDITKLKWSDVRQICISIDLMIKTINEYMLDLDSVIIKPEFMYMDMISKQVSFVYYPNEHQNFNQLLQNLFEYIIEHFDHSSNKKDILKVYSLYQNVNNGETDLMKLIHLCDSGKASMDDEHESIDGTTIETYNEAANEADVEINMEPKRNPVSMQKYESDNLIKDSNEFKNTNTDLNYTGTKNDRGIYQNENVMQKQKSNSTSEKEIGEFRSTRSGKKIDVIPEEELVQEQEEPVKSSIMLFRILRAISILVIFIGVIELFAPQYALLHLNLPLCIVLVVVGLFGALEFHNRCKKKELHTKMSYSTKKRPYVVQESDIENPSEHREKKSAAKKSKDQRHERQEIQRTAGIQSEKNKDKHYKKRTIVTKLPNTNEDDRRDNREYDRKKSDRDNNRENIRENVKANGGVGKRTVEQPGDIEETTNTILLSDYLKQSVLKKDPQIYLIPQESAVNDQEELLQKKICITSFPCIIGSMQGYCDVVILNKLVSRMHLCIRQLEDGWYLEDMNSTNGTYINGTRIKPNQQQKIKNQDEIRLAAASYKIEIC